MKRIGKTTIFVVLALVLALGALGVFGIIRATAVTPGLYLVDGNPNCGNLYQATVISGPDPDLLGLGPLFGFKYNNNPTGDLTHTLTDDGDWVVTNGPQDPANSVSIFNVLLSGTEGVQFDWSATLGLDAVIVKAQDANAYVYSPEAFGDSGLKAPGDKGISHIEFCYDYELTAEKTADAKYTRTYTWEITKDFDGEYWKFIGDAATTHDYKVSVDQTLTDSDFMVTGEITINNPTPFTVGFSVSDLVDGTAATVDCLSYELAPGGSTTCTYSADLGDTLPRDGTNVATISSLNGDVKDAIAEAGYTFGDPTTIIGDPTINVTDTNGESWSASGDDSWTYTKDFACPTDKSLYIDGKYSFTHDNTATITETGQDDDATVTVNCYLWDVSKTAEGTYNDQYGWDITKTVDPASQSGFAGDTLEWTWEITWNSFYVGEINHEVNGVITVGNPAPMELTVDVADYLTGGFAATVTCNDADGGTDLTIGANSSGTCSYTAAPGSQLAQNTATATRNDISVSKTVDVNWVQGADVGLDATISDSNHEDIPVGSDQPYTYTDSHPCEDTEFGAYGDDGTYSGSASNTATITWTGGSDSSSADTDYACYLWDVSKTADGSYQDQYGWDITKTVDPASQSGFAGDTLEWTWEITWNSFYVGEINHAVDGIITVGNPASMELTVDVADYLTGGFAATVTCNDADGGTDLTIGANSSGTCSYTAAPGSQLAQNTATATRNDISVSKTVDVNWVQGADVGLDATISDSNHEDIPVGSDQPYTYTDAHPCEGTDFSAYGDDGSYSGDADNTATITWTGGADSDSAHTDYDCYIPSISKTANGSYVEYHDWDVEKTVDPTSQSAFAGDTVYFDWTIDVTESVYEGDYTVTGQITVQNPNPEDALTVELADVLNDGTIAAIGPCTGGTWDGTYLTVPAGGTAVCDYEAADTGGPGLNNFAAALPDQVQFSLTYPVNGGDAYFPHVYVTGDPLSGDFDGWCVDTDNVIYQNTNYTANVYSSYEELPDGLVEKPWNFDLVNWILNQGFVGTPAGGTLGNYTYSDVQYAIWTLIDDAVSTAGLYNLNYTRAAQIVALAQANGEGYTPDCNDFIAVVLQPVLPDGTTTSAQVIAVAQVTMIEVDLECPAENTATATLNSIDFSATAEIDWAFTVEDDTAWMDDIQKPFDDEPVYDGYSVTYTGSDGYTCSSDKGDYTDGAMLDNMVSNTAIVYSGSGEEDSSTATTYIDCYIPSITKTAAGTYDERHEWGVAKDVEPTYQSGYPGDTLPWTWTIDVTEDVYEENFDVAGTITVGNPNPDDTLVVSLVDFVNGNAAVIDQTSCAFDGTYLTVLAGGSETCDYAANDLPYDDVDLAPDTNTATITLNGIDFDADATIEYTANVIRGSATLSDDEIGLTDVAVSGGDQKTGVDSVTCSSDRSAYGTTGSYGDTITNWAYLTDSESNVYSDDATTEWLCEASFVDLYKTTNGAPADPTKDISFALYSGTSLLSTVSTLNNGANLQFPTALVPGDTYTVCEYPVPAGYTFEISVNGSNVLTYAGPPGTENPTGEVQCFDFVAEVAGTTITFDVENRFPGGAPRTPGYWKNWNTCSGGNQAETAAKLGGVAEGVFLLDDLLPQTIGSLEITSCEDGVLILSAYSLDKEKNMNNDAAYTLARALLAARLNQDAGACDPDSATWWFRGEELTFEQLLNTANELLVGVDFDGTGSYLGPKDKQYKDLAADALYLYGIIDAYNNGYICTGEPSH